MARSHEHGSTVLLGLKGYLVEKVTEEDKGVIAQVQVSGNTWVDDDKIKGIVPP